MRNARPSQCQSVGFTLVELLVVVAIIALLLAILLPSLRKAQEAARQVRCAANQRQLLMAEGFYADDNRNRFTRFWGWDDQVWWHRRIQRYLGPTHISHGIECGSLIGLDEHNWAARNKSVLGNCPSASSQELASGTHPYQQASYALNTCLAYPKWNFRRYVVKSDSQVILLGDMRVNESDYLFTADSYRMPTGSGWNLTFWGATPGFRHNGFASFGYIDGHVETVDEEQTTINKTGSVPPTSRPAFPYWWGS